MYLRLLSLLTIAAAVSAATIDIDVGEDGSLKFDPNSTTAAAGDVLAFHFYTGSGAHSVVSSTFENPCVPDSGSFFSGYIAGNDEGDMVYEITVNSTDPIWYYCSLGKHCQAGMVGVINPPAGTDVAAYQTAAQTVASASAPPAPTGGALTTVAAAQSSASSTRSSASSTASASITPTSSGAAATSTSNAAHRIFGDASTFAGLAMVAGGCFAMIA